MHNTPFISRHTAVAVGYFALADPGSESHPQPAEHSPLPTGVSAHVPYELEEPLSSHLVFCLLGLAAARPQVVLGLLEEPVVNCPDHPSSFGLDLTSPAWPPLLSVPFLVSDVEGLPVFAV